jgi:hypothetical protein
MLILIFKTLLVKVVEALESCEGISGCHIMKWGASELCHCYTNCKRVALNLIIISIGIIRIGYYKNLLVSSQYMHQMMGTKEFFSEIYAIAKAKDTKTLIILSKN